MSDNKNAVRVRFASPLDAFLLSRRVENCRPKILAHYEYVVGGLLKSVLELAPEPVYAYLDVLKTRLSQAGYASHIWSLVVFFNWLAREGGPTIRLRIPRVDTLPKTYSPQDIGRRGSWNSFTSSS